MKKNSIRYYYNIMADYLMENIGRSAKTGLEKGRTYGRQTPISITVTKSQLINKLIKLKGKCAITNIPFPLVTNSYLYKAPHYTQFGINPMLIPSIDRIDSSKPYSIRNIQIVIRMVNMGKGMYSNEDTLAVFDMIKKPPKRAMVACKK